MCSKIVSLIAAMVCGILMSAQDASAAEYYTWAQGKAERTDQAGDPSLYYYQQNYDGTAASGFATSYVNGVAASYADLVSGTLRTYAHGAEPNGALYYPESWALAAVVDTLYIMGDIVAPVEGLLSIHIDGSLTPSSAYEIAFDSYSAFAGIGLSAWLGDVSRSYSSQAFLATPAITCPPSEPLSICETGSLFDLTFFLPFELRPGDTTVVVGANLQVGAYAGAIANFGNTATLSLTLPDGLTYTSASGVFLTQQAPTPAPEPSSLTLTVLAAALCGACSRRRAAQGAPARRMFNRTALT